MIALRTLYRVDASVPGLAVKQPFDRYFSTNGKQNAKVFPEPVKSQAIRSSP